MCQKQKVARIFVMCGLDQIMVYKKFRPLYHKWHKGDASLEHVADELEKKQTFWRNNTISAFYRKH